MWDDSVRDEEIIDIEGLIREIKEKSGSSQDGKQTIPRVPATLKGIMTSLKWIKPSVISIGPYYYREKLQGDALKPLWADKFILDSNQNSTELYRKIEREIKTLGDFYDNQKLLGIDDKTLSLIFFFDGCFLLQFIRYFCSGKEDELNRFENHRMRQDIFLLENQIPFRVLRFLYEGAKFPGKKSMEDMIKDFVTSNNPMARPQSKTQLKNEENEPFHLLDLLRGVLLGSWKQITTDNSTHRRTKGAIRKISPNRLIMGFTASSNEDNPVNGRLITGSRSSSTKDDPENERQAWYSYRNVQELMEVGIIFKPSDTNCLTDISFTSFFGVTGCLKLPPVTINGSNKIIFMNLIAQEYSSTLNGSGVISFLCFLDSLIDHWDDVKELQAARVLHNFIGDRKDVAQFFNEGCSMLAPDPNIYKEVREKIQKHVERHSESNVRMWLIQCKHTYFRNPWTVIALAGALVGLFLTAVQTYTAVFVRSSN